MSCTDTYFGFGPMTDPDIMEALLGRLPKQDHRQSWIEGWGLVIQNQEHIPNIPKVYEGVSLNPYEIIKNGWKTPFRTYTIIKQEGGVVYGTIWSGLTDRDRALIHEWGLIPWEWFAEVRLIANTTSGQTRCCLLYTSPSPRDPE